MQEKLSFSSHSSLLLTVIKSQAGSLAKALLEAVMNSVDAGASAIRIELSETAFSVMDDGHGITDRNELERVFATFGTPHEEGDAVFGRFRVGRGQMFAFAATQWRTGTFRMSVDLEHQGLDFNLESNLRPVKGCQIKGSLYLPLSPMELSETGSELLDMIQFLNIPVSLNGKRISRKLDAMNWTFQNSDAFVLLDRSTELAVYNQGVLVRKYPASLFGSGGVIVSKVPLQVNMARNDVLTYSCSVWNRLKALIKAHSLKLLRSRRSLTDVERRYAASLISSLPDEARGLDIASMKLIMDASGRYLALKDLANFDRISWIPDHRRDEGLVAQRKTGALVLSQSSMQAFNAYDLSELLDTIRQACGLKIGARVIDFAALQSSMDHVADRVADGKLPISELLALQALRGIQADLVALIDQAGFACEKRDLCAGLSDVYDGWTDGQGWIAVNRPLLAACSTQGASGFMKLMLLLIHEYCHDTSDAESHDHDRVFFNKYHDITYASAEGLLNLTVAASDHFLELKEGLRQKREQEMKNSLSRSQLDLFSSRAAA